jgi:hypothetical protein
VLANEPSLSTFLGRPGSARSTQCSTLSPSRLPLDRDGASHNEPWRGGSIDAKDQLRDAGIAGRLVNDSQFVAQPRTLAVVHGKCELVIELKRTLMDDLGNKTRGLQNRLRPLEIQGRQPRRKRSPAPLSRVFFYMEVGRGRFQLLYGGRGGAGFSASQFCSNSCSNSANKSGRITAPPCLRATNSNRNRSFSPFLDEMSQSSGP